VFGQLAVTYVDHAITIGGAKPNSKIAIYGISQSKEVTELLTRDRAVVRADAGGNAVYAVRQPAFRSVWVIFDVTSGEYVVSSPAGYKVRRVSPPSGSLGEGDGIRNPWLTADVFVARKGAGAWSGRGADRQRSGAAVVAVQAMTSLDRDGPPPPQRLTVGDVVFAIDVTDMEFWAVQVTPADVKGGSDAH